MNSNIGSSKVDYIPVNVGIFTVNLGVAGWVDTDVSATTGLDQTRIWFVGALGSAGALIAGARPAGSTADSKLVITNAGAVMTKVAANGHVELYRNAGGDVSYYFIGYIRTGSA